MKVLKKKLKKVGKVKKFFYNLTIILYIITFAYFIYGILKLKGIENLIRGLVIGFFALWFLIYTLCGLITMISKKTKTFIFITFLSLIFCPIFVCSSYYVNKVYNSISSMNNEKVIYTTNLIALKETEFSSELTIGMIESEDDIEGNVLAKKLIEKENLTNKIETFEDYHSMITALYAGEIGGCFVTNNYAITFEGEEFETVEEGETATSISNRVKVVYEYSEEMDNQDTTTLATSNSKTLTEPFTVLVMGVDSTLDGLKANQAFNGDTLIMITFNPSTLTATMFSIPRDLYVPIACNNNRYAKINSSAAYGSSCVISTVQQLTGIDIDYYVKINFTGVVDLVDALGGIEVEIEEPDYWYDESHINQVCEQNSKRQKGSNLVCMGLGLQTLNGEQALAYARCRHLYAISDIARNQHQQAIIEAMAQKLKTVNSISEFESVLDAVSNNIETNMTADQMLSFYSVAKDMLANSSSTALSIKKTYLSYYSLPVYLQNSGMYTSALGYYQESLDAIISLMKVNLELETETPTKTFSISYNEEYETPLVGKGLTGGEKLQKVQSFIGSDRYTASAWCQSNGLSCTFETTTDSATAGLIVNQSVHEGVLVKSISSITFYVSDGLGTETEITTDNTTSDNTETDENNETNQEENTDENQTNQDTQQESDDNQNEQDTNTDDEDSTNNIVPGNP